MKMCKERKYRGGFTLVELIVVMAIVGVMAAVAIPSFARLGFGSRDEVSRAAREVYSQLRAARIYSATYRVNAAVVYNLDNYVSPLVDSGNTPGLAAPAVDSVTGQVARYVNAVAVMYQLPGSGALYFNGGEDAYVIAPDYGRDFTPLPENTGVLLKDPSLGYKQIFTNQLPRYVAGFNEVPADNSQTQNGQGVGLLGMRVNTDPISDEVVNGVTVILDGGPYGGGPMVFARFPAHVFTPGGRLDASGTKERYSIFVGPRPDAGVDERLIDPTNPTEAGNLVGSEIELYRSTGRVKISS